MDALLSLVEPVLRMKVTPTENPNDHLSSKAVNIEFYNQKNRAVGMASVSAIDTETPFLYNVEVYEEYRGKKYANCMMSLILQKYKPMLLTVETSNHIAIRLYQKYGFYIYGKFKDGNIMMYEMRRR